VIDVVLYYQSEHGEHYCAYECTPRNAWRNLIDWSATPDTGGRVSVDDRLVMGWWR
jgi:hypothetical protein